MNKAAEIKELADLLDRINAVNIKIFNINKMLKYDFKVGRFGKREFCRSELTFFIEGHLAESHCVNMSDKVAKALGELLKVSLSEETKIADALMNKYNALLCKLTQE